MEGILHQDAVGHITDRLRRYELDDDRPGGHFAWLVFSVALLLSDRWLDPDPPKDVLRFPIPV